MIRTKMTVGSLTYRYVLYDKRFLYLYGKYFVWTKDSGHLIITPVCGPS